MVVIQHILVGAEEGIYTLNLNELHENAMDLLYPRRTVWMFVIKDVLMTISGKKKNLNIFRNIGQVLAECVYILSPIFLPDNLLISFCRFIES
jgi:hypothetical protein